MTRPSIDERRRLEVVVRDRGVRDERVDAGLRRLGVAWTASDATLLAGGQSGAAVYRLDRAGECAVLKFTRADAAPGLIAQARREARFYREVAPLLSIPAPHPIALTADDDPDIALLLAAYDPVGAIDRWTPDELLAIARQLGRLHSAFWDGADSLPDWIEAAPPATMEQRQIAARRWRALGERPELRAIVDGALIEALIARIPDWRARIVPFPATLCHGDCHAENVLRDVAGDLILGDWQQVRLGSGVDDLAFFFQRAFAATAHPLPLDAMVRAYAETLTTGAGLAIPIAQIEQQFAWSELCSWLLAWPEYLGFLPVASVARILARIDGLRSRLGIAQEP